MSPSHHIELDDDVVRANERHLWGLCYRLTGSAADADEIVQQTFERALHDPPRWRDRSRAPAEDVRPWLVRVATNLARDRLRQRKRWQEHDYDGPWLPTPVACEAVDEALVSPERPDARYGRLESATWAFLIALEELTPLRRAVLVLRDVLGYSTAETADALEISESNVKTTLHRARRQMASYDAHRNAVPAEPDEERARERLVNRHRAAMLKFFAALLGGRPKDVEKLLAEDVRTIQDAGGVYHAARNVVRGRFDVAALFVGLMRTSPWPVGFDERLVGGVPVWRLQVPEVAGRRYAPQVVLGLELETVDGSDVIRRVYLLLEPEKVARAWD